MMQQAEIKFRTLRLEGWRQFDFLDIELHPRLTVITGANGVGKSSVLRIFSRHFGFERPFLGTPQLSASGGYAYFTGVFESIWSRITRQKQSASDIGVLIYENGVESGLQVPHQAGVQYNIGIMNQQPVPGIHIDSHQAISPYQPVGQIPTNLVNSQSAYSNYHNELRTRYQGGHSGMSPLYRMKEAIISMAMFGEGNSHVEGNTEILHAYRGFVAALRKMLPESLGFMDLAVRPPDVVLITKSGEFLIDASSGGLMTLIDLAWRLHMFALTQKSFVVTIDEPENHLHPTMQRSLMRRLLEAFPQAQFIIATHSPFMVSSVRESNVYVLRYVPSGDVADSSETLSPTSHRRVISERLDTVNKAGSASEILREVLGVSATVPEWVEDGLNAVVTRYRQQPITREMLTDLRRELTSLGYDELYPDALAALTKDR